MTRNPTTLAQRAAAWARGVVPFMRSARPAGTAQVRRFAAARIDRHTADWLDTQNSINQELRTDLAKLRSRGRDLVNNNDYARKFAGMCADNIIGPAGIRLQARVFDPPTKPGQAPIADELANAAIESAWLEWCAVADYNRRQTLRDLCATACAGLPADGEFLWRIVRGKAAGNRFGLAIQAIDVDRIDTMHNQQLPGGAAVVMGVEIDAFGTPQALHIFAAHPNDGERSSRQRMRVPVADLIHAFKVDRAGQVRGIPWMAPGMLSLHHLGSFMLAAILAAENGANHYGFFTTPDGVAPLGAADATTGEQITTSQPGTYDTLPAGVTFQAHESKYPSETFGPFVKTALQRVATGWRVSYHSLANDLEGVSFSSIRSGTLEERDRWAADQEWFITVALERVFTEWLQAALLLGAITMPNGSPLPAAKYAKFVQHEWQPRRWDWVDPKSDMEAKILAIRAGLMAPQDVAASMGYDFADNIAAIAAANKSAEAAGVQLTAYAATPGAVPHTTQPPATPPAKAAA